MKAGIALYFALLLCVWGSSTVAGEPSAEVRAAVIPDAKAPPSDAVMAQLEAGLSQAKGCVLVERAQIRKVLTEQKLSLSGLVDPKTAIKAGGLLSADVLVLVEQMPKDSRPGTVRPGSQPSGPKNIPPEILSKLPPEALKRLQGQATDNPPSRVSPDAPAACRIRVVEVQSGVILASTLIEEKELAEDSAAVVGAIRSAIGKSRLPLENKVFIGVLGFQSEEPGHLLDGLGQVIGDLLTVDLANAPNVVLLERSHIRYLQNEKDLSGAEQKLRASAFLVEGGIRRVSGQDKLAVTAKIRPLAGGTEERASAEVEWREPASLRKAIAGMVIGKLKNVSAPAVNPDPKKEAAIFAKRARLLGAYGEFESSTHAIDVALALDKTPETLEYAIQTYRSWAADLVGMEALSGRKACAPETKQRAFLAVLRAYQLAEEAVVLHDALREKGDKVRPEPQGLTGESQVMTVQSMPISPEEKDTLEIRREMAGIAAATYGRRLGFIEKNWTAESEGEWWRRLADLSAVCVWNCDAKGWVEVLRQNAAKIGNPPGKIDPWGRPGQAYLTTQIQSLQPGKHQFNSPEEQRIVEEALDWLAVQKSPYLQLMANQAKYRYTCYLDTEAAGAALRIIMQDKPPDNRELVVKVREGHRDALDAVFAEQLLRVLGPAPLDKCCRPLVEASIRDNDPSRLSAWRDVIDKWLTYTERCGKIREADQVVERMLTVLNGCIKDPVIQKEFRGAPARYIPKWAEDLEKRRRDYAASLAGSAVPASSGALKLTRVNVGAIPANCTRLVAALADGNRLILVHTGDPADEVYVHVSAVPMDGGAPVALGNATVGCSMQSRAAGNSGRKAPVTCVAADKSAVYVGTAEGGLLVVANGRATVISEQAGLPAKGVVSAACMDGKLYLGFGNPAAGQGVSTGALAEFDPQKKTFQLLASARSQQVRNGLDGGAPYDVTSLLADDKRKCLWLGLWTNAEDRRGLWKYSLDTGKAERVWATAFGVRDMRWSDGKLLVWSSAAQNGLVSIDPDSMKKVLLVGPKGWAPSADCAAEPLLGAPRIGDRLWPSILLGERAITGGKGVSIYESGGKDPERLDQIPEGGDLQRIREIQAVGGRTLVIAESGDVLALEPKASGPAPAVPPAGGQSFQVAELLTGESLAPAALEAGKFHGLVVDRVEGNLPAARHGIRGGDLIIAADGLRIYGMGEYNLALSRGPAKTSLDLLVSRRGRIFQVQIQDLVKTRRTGFYYDPQYERFPAILKDLGIGFEPEMAQSLGLYPSRAVAEIAMWIEARPENRQAAPAWLKEHVELYLNMVNQEYGKAKAPREAPIPYLNRLAKFYVSLAARNANGEQLPDPKAHGESIDFYLANYPYPKYTWPGLGDLPFSDTRFGKLLAATRANPYLNIWHRKQMAEPYVARSEEAGNTADLLNHVKASLLAPEHYRHLSYPCKDGDVRVPALEAPLLKAKTLADLRSGMTRNDGDAALCAYALIAPAMIAGDKDEAIRLLDFLQKRCPFLALHAVVQMQNVSDCWSNDALFDALMAHVAKSGLTYSNRPCKLCEEYVKKAPDRKGVLVPLGPGSQLIGPDDFLHIQTARIKSVIDSGK